MRLGAAHRTLIFVGDLRVVLFFAGEGAIVGDLIQLCIVHIGAVLFFGIVARLRPRLRFLVGRVLRGLGHSARTRAVLLPKSWSPVED